MTSTVTKIVVGGTQGAGGSVCCLVFKKGVFPQKVVLYEVRENP